jgi:hypothetical protein
MMAKHPKLVIDTIKTVSQTSSKKYAASLCRHFQNEHYMHNLVRLYRRSQRECTRNNRLTPDIGTSREKDLVASLLSDRDLVVNYKIPNSHGEDVVVDDEMISIKHSSNKRARCNGLKVIWTSNEKKQGEYINNNSTMLSQCHLLVIFVRFHVSMKSMVGDGTMDIMDKGELEILFIDKATIFRQHHLHLIRDEPVLKCLKGNSRGIEFTSKFFAHLIENTEFQIKIAFEGFGGDEKPTDYDPILSRLMYLKL